MKQKRMSKYATKIQQELLQGVLLSDAQRAFIKQVNQGKIKLDFENIEHRNLVKSIELTTDFSEENIRKMADKIKEQMDDVMHTIEDHQREFDRLESDYEVFMKILDEMRDPDE